MHVLILGGTRFAGRAVTDGYGRGLRGVFNVTGEPTPFGRLLGQCVAGTDSRGAVRLLAGPGVA